MTTELVLLLSIYAYIVMGVFLGDFGPLETFKKSGPRLGARIERNISIGQQFQGRGGQQPDWDAAAGEN
ncbi:MAG: hypothetical protein AB7N80_05890 [Bdellovibrionales bacterium]